MCDPRDLSSVDSNMASPTDVVETLPETAAPSETAAPGVKGDAVHEETPEVEDPKS